MNIDLATIALILVLSSIFQAIFILLLSSKYPGVDHFGVSCSFYALGFLFVMLQGNNFNDLFTVVIGNALLLLALIFQYMGLVRFLELPENRWFPPIIFGFCLFALIYFQFIFDSISARIFAINLSIGLISLLSAQTLNNHKNALIPRQIQLLFLLFATTGVFAVVRAVHGLFSPPLDNALSPSLFQIISFTGAFIANIIVTFTFIIMVNERVSSEIRSAKEQFEQIFNLSPDASLITTLPDGKIVNFNLGFLNFTGFSQEDVQNKSVLDLNLYENPADREKLLEEITANQSIDDFELNFRNKDREIRICAMSAKIIQMNNTPHIISIINDITDRKNAEAALIKSEEKYRFLTEFASDVIWLFNLSQNKFTYMSPAIFQLRGLTPEEAIAENLEVSMTGESLQRVRAELKKNVNAFIANPDAPNTYLIEIQQPCQDGRLIWVEVSTKYRYHVSGDIELVGVSRNIDKRKQAEEAVLYLSYHDQLTGLYNRRFYEEELLRLDTPRNLPIALIMADVNGLKLINDAYGHQMGDKVLKEFAEILKKECRHDEIASRVGGDEFVVLFSHTDQQSVESIVKRLNVAVSQVQIDHTILSVSMGFALKEDPHDDLNDVFKRAEDAMYQHKLIISPSIKRATIDLIVNSIYERNHQEVIHSQAVSEYCQALARTLDFDTEAINQLGLAGLRHDIGEIAIDEAILTKSEKLSESEWAEIKRHPEIGYHILRSVNELAEIAKFVLEHHERWDGQGYPKGLKADEISLQGRIIAIADAYCTMTTERPYCRALTEAEAIKEIKKCAGLQFDENLARLFVEKVLQQEWPPS
ncbi:HD domain-containing phosphohydrolase [Acetobacterium malicum]|uniref:HD domain-containing phosphohydrolase n=1 Tax=Acetobacterium malicum TaxID=52692 RepID=UPI0004058D52|nr:HD domain-containing phosphohydrolase [Acetobacterium dehalogenans]